jgi:hypothetical protein
MGDEGRRTKAERTKADVLPISRRASETRKQVLAWTDSLIEQTRQHPGRSVAMAVGVGYVLGGGLFSPLTGRLLGTGIRIGLRAAVLPFVTEGLAVLGQRHTTQKET